MRVLNPGRLKLVAKFILPQVRNWFHGRAATVFHNTTAREIFVSKLSIDRRNRQYALPYFGFKTQKTVCIVMLLALLLCGIFIG